jgi:hypothetical protein
MAHPLWRLDNVKKSSSNHHSGNLLGGALRSNKQSLRSVKTNATQRRCPVTLVRPQWPSGSLLDPVGSISVARALVCRALDLSTVGRLTQRCPRDVNCRLEPRVRHSNLREFASSGANLSPAAIRCDGPVRVVRGVRGILRVVTCGIRSRCRSRVD